MPSFQYSGPKETVKEARHAIIYAIIGLFCFGIILGPIAIVKGTQAKNLIAMDPRLEGSGMATAAQILGAIEIIIFICYFFGNLSRR